jgi:tetratricopeptide (TPR) repeat protein
MYCTKCGAKAIDGARYCAWCGTPLCADAAQEAPGPSAAAEAAFNRGKDCGINHQEAVKEFTEAISLCPTYIDAYAERGQSYQWLGRYDQAVADFNEGLRLDPQSDCLYNCRGDVYKDMGRYEEAIADFEKSIAIYEENGYPQEMIDEIREIMKKEQ